MRDSQQTRSFEKALKALVKKHADLEERVLGVLASIAQNGPHATANRMPGLDGEPVFKERIPWAGQGARGSARLIYRCDDDSVLALFIYSKNDREPPRNAVREVLVELSG